MDFKIESWTVSKAESDAQRGASLRTHHFFLSDLLAGMTMTL